MYNEKNGEIKMLPVITEDMSAEAFSKIFNDVNGWRKSMIHYIKEENPEVNTAIITAAQKTGADPKSVALGAYLVYNLLETASAAQDNIFNSFNQ